jgi:cystinosin
MAASLLAIISKLFGWVYTICWSLSFYPQPILNFRRQSTSGTTIDFPAINVLGFLAYFVSNAAFLYSSQIRHEYALRHHGLTPTVQFNDLAFAGHAVIITAITLTQFSPAIWGFDKKGKRGPGARVSKSVLGILLGSILGVAVVAVIVAAKHDEDPEVGWAAIDVVCLSLQTTQEQHADLKFGCRSTPYHMSSSSLPSSNTCHKFSRTTEIAQHMAGR